MEVEKLHQEVSAFNSLERRTERPFAASVNVQVFIERIAPNPSATTKESGDENHSDEKAIIYDCSDHAITYLIDAS